MVTDSLFQVLPAAAESGSVAITFDGRPLRVPAGAGVERFRTTPVSGAARAPYCMMGVCFECLVEIDGAQSRQSCLVTVEHGMVIRSQHGMRALAENDAMTEGARDAG
jgi:predicted molibdopterin-dependent oxidoreductase YjgC